MIAWSLDAFGACESVGSIVVAAPPGHAGDLRGETDSRKGALDHSLAADEDASAPEIAVVEGGATRARSVANALEAVATDFVAIHDAARPLLTPALVEALIAEFDAAPAAAGVIAAAPLVDTIKRALKETRVEFDTSRVSNPPLAIEATEDRSRLWAAQTPQVFRTQALREALTAAERPQEATDEAMLVERAGGTVLIHRVAEPNLKVTTPLDLRVAELLLAERAAVEAG